MDYRIECYHHGADCLKFIHRYYLKTLGGPLQLVVVLVILKVEIIPFSGLIVNHHCLTLADLATPFNLATSKFNTTLLLVTILL